MSKHTEQQCPKCGQRLRFPTNVGGIVMACPTCGKKFSSDFKLAASGNRRPRKRHPLIVLFELPATIVSRIVRALFR